MQRLLKRSSGIGATETAKAYGRPAPQDVVSALMASPSLNTTPAPDDPASLVEHPNLANYYNALDATYEILKMEHDKMRRLKAEEFRAWLETAIAQFEEPDQSTQPPAPMPTPIPSMPPSGAAPPPGGNPGGPGGVLPAPGVMPPGAPVPAAPPAPAMAG